MTLPHVDFVNLADVPALPCSLEAGAEQVDLTVRTLNAAAAAADAGRRTLIVDCPAGTRLPRGHWSCDLEILVLNGLLEVDGERLERYAYLFVPAGVAVGPVEVTGGDVSLVLFASGVPAITAADDDVAGAPRGRLVGPIHVGDVPWEKPMTEGFPAGAGRKTLRIDEEAGESFWILGLLPHWSSPVAEWHAFAEENFILEGEIQTTEGLMTTGSYLSHLSGEDTVHGPMRSRAGSLLITRAFGGPLQTTYSVAEHDLDGPWR